MSFSRGRRVQAESLNCYSTLVETSPGHSGTRAVSANDAVRTVERRHTGMARRNSRLKATGSGRENVGIGDSELELFRTVSNSTVTLVRYCMSTSWRVFENLTLHRRQASLKYKHHGIIKVSEI